MSQQEQTETEPEDLRHYVCLAPYRYFRDPEMPTLGRTAGNQLQLLMHLRDIPGESESVPALISVPIQRKPIIDDAISAFGLFFTSTVIERRFLRYGGTFIPGDSELRYHLFFVDMTNISAEIDHSAAVKWQPLRNVLHYQDPMLYVAYAEIHALLFHA